MNLSEAKCLSKKDMNKNAYGKINVEAIFYQNDNIYIWNTTDDRVAYNTIDINGIYEIDCDIQSQIPMNANFIAYISNVRIVNILSTH